MMNTQVSKVLRHPSYKSGQSHPLVSSYPEEFEVLNNNGGFPQWLSVTALKKGNRSIPVHALIAQVVFLSSLIDMRGEELFNNGSRIAKPKAAKIPGPAALLPTKTSPTTIRSSLPSLRPFALWLKSTKLSLLVAAGQMLSKQTKLLKTDARPNSQLCR